MASDQFEEAARDAGFSRKQIDFFVEHVARFPHTHNAEEINGLEETVAELVEAEMGDEEFPDDDYS